MVGEANDELGTSAVTHDDREPGPLHVMRQFEGNQSVMQMELPEVSFSILFYEIHYYVNKKHQDGYERSSH